MSEIKAVKVNGLWEISLIENGEVVADETVQFEEERDEIIALYLEGMQYGEVVI